jgi:hypothetical protein
MQERDEALERALAVAERDAAIAVAAGAVPTQIRRTIPRLRRRRALREVAMRLMEGPAPVDSVLPMLEAVSDLSRWRQADRDVAVWALQRARLTATQREQCASHLSRFIEKTRRPDGGQQLWGCLKRSYLTVFSLGCASILARFATSWPNPEDLNSSILMIIAIALTSLFASFFLSPFILPFSLMMDTWACSRARSAVTALGNLHPMHSDETAPSELVSPTAVGQAPSSVATDSSGLQMRRSISTLAAAYDSRWMKPAAGPALKAALPGLRSAHYGNLGEAQTIPRLCWALTNTGTDTELTLLILDALEKVGDARAIPFVKRLDRRAGDSAVRQRSVRVLRALIERDELERSARVLLRAASAPAIQADMLLRPARGIQEPEPDHLLRPSGAVETRTTTTTEAEPTLNILGNATD